jgi:hypothetical protein
MQLGSQDWSPIPEAGAKFSSGKRFSNGFAKRCFILLIEGKTNQESACLGVLGRLIQVVARCPSSPREEVDDAGFLRRGRELPFRQRGRRKKNE